MGFPPAGSEIYYNDAGEPTGWSAPAEPDYCEWCGMMFMGPHDCMSDADDDEEFTLEDAHEYYGLFRNDQERDFEEERFNEQLMREE